MIVNDMTKIPILDPTKRCKHMISKSFTKKDYGSFLTANIFVNRKHSAKRTNSSLIPTRCLICNKIRSETCCFRSCQRSSLSKGKTVEQRRPLTGFL